MFLNKDTCIFLFLSLKKEKSSRVHINFFIKDLYTKCTQIYKYNVVFCTYDKVALFELHLQTTPAIFSINNQQSFPICM